MKSAKLWVLLGVMLAGNFSVLAQTNVNEEQGMKPYDSWHGGDLDSVSMTNGGLVLHIPLVSFPQRGNLDLSFSVLANTKQWQSKVNLLGCPPNSGCVPQWSPIVGMQGAYAISSLDWSPANECSVEPGNETNDFTPTYTWSGSVIAPDGNAHPFGNGSSPYGCGSVPRALDASGILQAGNNIIMPNGTRFTYDSNGLLSNVTDSNGNRITMDIQPGRYTDTLGRVIALPPNTYSTVTSDLSNCPSGTATAKTWTIPGPSGGTRTFKFCYSNISIYTSFGQGGTEYGPANSSLLTALVLPDLTLWTFSYDHYADVTRLGFPTGGSISYTYAIGPQTCGAGTPVSMEVTSRTVDANDGTGGHTFLYNYSGQYSTNSGSYSGTTIVTSPDGNDTAHTITTPVAGASCSFYDTQMQYYQGAHNGGTLLKTTTTQYAEIANPVGSDGMTAAKVVPIQDT